LHTICAISARDIQVNLLDLEAALPMEVLRWVRPIGFNVDSIGSTVVDLVDGKQSACHCETYKFYRVLRFGFPACGAGRVQ
jgi:hypothetical protein